MKYRKSPLFLVTLMVLAMLAAAFVTVPTVSAYTITVDGNPADWQADTTGQAINTFMEYDHGSAKWPYQKEYVWRDEFNDDTGSNGTYIYPTTFTGNESDLLEFRTTWNDTYVFFLFRMADIVPGQWNRTYISLAIDQDQIPGSGNDWIYGVTEVKTAEEAMWEYDLVTIGGDVRRGEIWPCVINVNYQEVCNQTSTPPLLIANDSDTNCFEVGIPTAVIGNPSGKIWRYTLIVCLHNELQTEPPGEGEKGLPLGPMETADDIYPGGGVDEWTDPDAFDAAFYPSKAAQETDLGDWSLPETVVQMDVYQDVAYLNTQMGELYVGTTSDPDVYDPVNMSLPNVCTDFTVYIKTRNITDLWAVNFSMNYDPTILNCTAVRVGASWGTLDTDYEGLPGTINQTTGKIEGYAYSRKSAALPVNATLFEVDFHVIGTLPPTRPPLVSILQIYCKPIELLDDADKPIYPKMTDGKLWGTTAPHDIAIIDVVPSPTTVKQGDKVNVTITAKNDGLNTETFTVQAFYGNATGNYTIGTHPINNLAPGTSTTFNITWNTAGVTPGTYTIYATNATVVEGETDIADNIFRDGDVTVLPLVHDVAIISVYPALPLLPAIPTEGLVAYWNFDEGSGTVASDSIGGFHGTVIGADWKPGKFGSALEFNKTDMTDRVDVGDYAGLEGFTGLTINAWIYPYSYRLAGEIVKKDLVYLLRVNTDVATPNQTMFDVWIPAENKLLVSDYNWTLNTWTMITATWDGSKMRIYKNDATLVGEKVASATQLATSTHGFTIGNRDDTPWDEPWDGMIDEVKIYNRALTIAEIQQLYGFAPAAAVYQGDKVNVTITAKNEGDYNEAFTVQAFYGNATGNYTIGTHPINNLAPGTSTTFNITWNTAGVTPGTYTISANTSIVPGETHTADNSFIDGNVTVLPPEVPDVAVTSVIDSDSTHGQLGTNWGGPGGGAPLTPVKWAHQTWDIEIGVTVKNNGTASETFNVNVFYANATGNYTIGISPAYYSVTLGPGASTTKTFTWRPPKCSTQQTYTIYANVTVLLGETATADNIMRGNDIKVMLIGDTDADGDCDLDDLIDFGALWTCITKADLSYWPWADFDNTGFAELDDLIDFGAAWVGGPFPAP